MLRKLKGLIKDALASIFFSMVSRTRPVIAPDAAGLNFIGFAKADMGLGEALRALVRSARSADVPLLVRDFDPGIRSKQDNTSMMQFLAFNCNYPINCFCINPDILYRAPKWLRFEEWAKKYNIGYWFWELSNFPQSWRYALKLVDEIWVNTEYVAEAMRQSGKSVYKIPFAVAIEPPSKKFNREYLGLEAQAFLYLFSYDFLSSSGRKNPEAVVEAFLKAFPAGESAAVGLIIKSVNGEVAPAELAELRERLSSDRRITIIDRQLTTDEMHALIGCCDSYISLHRAEGLGLGMAEAMYLGKPVIATAYSGNMEYMNKDNSCLIPYQLIPVNPEDYPNAAGQVWADPDIDAAAVAMRKVFDEPEFVASIGENAAAYMKKHHSLEVAGQAIYARLQKIQANSVQPTVEKIPRSLLMLGQRGLQALVSLVTMIFIAKYLSPESQGWYYAFLSLASLYTLADLGLSVALVPYFARSFASTSLLGWGLNGPESTLLTERLQQSFDWYVALAVLYVLILLPFGMWFFGRLPAGEASWMLPWMAIVFTCAGQLLLLPLMAFVEAAGKVVAITFMRLVQIGVGGGICWMLLYDNQALWAAFVVAFSGVVVPFVWLRMKWPLLFSLIGGGIGKRFSFKTSIVGVQWRIAVSWICAYLSSQIYSLILMQLDGSVVSGQLALTMAIANMVGVLALSSMAGKVAFVGHDAARNDISKFQAKFKDDLVFFSSVYALGVLSVLVSYWFIQDKIYATRVLPLWQIVALLGFMFVVNLLNLFSTYVRSYLREPFMRVNVIGTLLTLPLAYLGAMLFSSAGVVTALAGVALLVTLPLAVIVWRSEIRNTVGVTELKAEHEF